MSVFSKTVFSFLASLLLLLVSVSANATVFKVGDVVFVAYPAGNIKDDAFIIGQVTDLADNGDYYLRVIDYVEGHDYGLSCVPMVKRDTDEGKSTFIEGWDQWKDPTVLEKEKLNYLVKKQDVMPLEDGRHLFIERNNLFFVFGRWKSDAPMLTIDRLIRAEREVMSAGLEDLLPAIRIAKLHRQSFYGEHYRPLWAEETVKPLILLMHYVNALLQKDKVLFQHWQAEQRNWMQIGMDTRLYFLIEAIDKVVNDAHDQLYADGIEKADKGEWLQLKELVDQYRRR